MENNEFVVRDPDDIRPARPISQKEIDEVTETYRQLPDRSFDQQIYYYCEIGFKLRCWHDLLPDGGWTNWYKVHLKQIPEPAIGVCLRLWDNNERVSNALQKRNPKWKTPYYL